MSGLSERDKEIQAMDGEKFANYAAGHLLIAIGEGRFSAAVREILVWDRIRLIAQMPATLDKRRSGMGCSCGITGVRCRMHNP